MSLIIVYIVTWGVLSVFLFRTMEIERAQNMVDNSERIVSNIRSIIENYDNILYRLSNNRIIYKSLSDKCRNYEDVWLALTNIKYTLNEDMARTSSIKKLEIYQQGSDIGQDGRYVFSDEFDSTKLENSSWLTETSDGVVMLYKYRKISSLYNEVEAYIKSSIESQEVFGTATEIGNDMSGSVYLTNENDIVIASSDTNTLANSIGDIIPSFKTIYIDNEIIENDEYMVMKSHVSDNWYVWVIVSSSQFAEKINRSKRIVGIILLGYGICSEIALSILLNRIFGRLNKLGDNMEQIQGDMTYINIPEKFDEVTILEVKYNSMLNKLDDVIDEMADVKSQKQKFEFKSLESQINPHFLYNTLGVMRWEALECENSKLVYMIDDLSTFYRLSLNKGQGLLTVLQEFKLVQAYINIQQIRWDNVVNVKVSVEPEVEDIMIPKMILQPLVENIWLHGNITAEGNRKIEISARDAGYYVEFRIWDNGDGISRDVLKRFKNEKRSNEESSFGIGMQFIKDILRYYYKENYIYKVTSDKLSGTLILIKLPKRME